MAELLEKLGIDWKLLIANTITFFLVLWVLKKFAFRPIMTLLEKRQQTVAESLHDAKQTKEELHKFQVEKEQLLKEARQTAQGMLREAEQQAEAMRQEKLEQSQAEAQQLVIRTREQLAREQTQMLAEAKGKLADLVVTATTKVLEDTVDDSMDAKLQQKAAGALKGEQA
jgi:F-type H+-transporting ATPase subunit b